MALINLFVVLVASLVCFTLAEEKYSSKFENVDVDKVLNDDSLLTSLVNCLLDEETCTEEGQALKSITPDVLKTSCSKCTDVLKTKLQKIVQFLYKNRSSDFDRLLAKYDPSGEYKNMLQKLATENAATAKH